MPPACRHTRSSSPDWYLRRNEHVARQRRLRGRPLPVEWMVEGRSPSPVFDVRWYLEAYPDVAVEGENPLVHTFGRAGAKVAIPTRSST